MTDDRPDNQEIETNEQWLRSIDEPAMADHAKIKERLHIELGERWLAEQMGSKNTDELASDAKRRIQDAVRNEARQWPHGNRLYRFLRPTLGIAALSAAALLVFWLLPMSAVTDEMVSADAFDQYETDEFDNALRDFDSELQELELVMDDWGRLTNSDWLDDDVS